MKKLDKTICKSTNPPYSGLHGSFLSFRKQTHKKNRHEEYNCLVCSQTVLLCKIHTCLPW